MRGVCLVAQSNNVARLNVGHAYHAGIGMASIPYAQAFVLCVFLHFPFLQEFDIRRYFLCILTLTTYNYVDQCSCVLCVVLAFSLSAWVLTQIFSPYIYCMQYVDCALGTALVCVCAFYILFSFHFVQILQCMDVANGKYPYCFHYVWHWIACLVLLWNHYENQSESVDCGVLFSFIYLERGILSHLSFNDGVYHRHAWPFPVYKVKYEDLWKRDTRIITTQKIADNFENLKKTQPKINNQQTTRFKVWHTLCFNTYV